MSKSSICHEMLSKSLNMSSNHISQVRLFPSHESTALPSQSMIPSQEVAIVPSQTLSKSRGRHSSKSDRFQVKTLTIVKSVMMCIMKSRPGCQVINQVICRAKSCVQPARVKSVPPCVNSQVNQTNRCQSCIFDQVNRQVSRVQVICGKEAKSVMLVTYLLCQGHLPIS